VDQQDINDRTRSALKPLGLTLSSLLVEESYEVHATETRAFEACIKKANMTIGQSTRHNIWSYTIEPRTYIALGLHQT